MKIISPKSACKMVKYNDLNIKLVNILAVENANRRRDGTYEMITVGKEVTSSILPLLH